MSVRIKICGITNPADAIAAARFGADALGFVLYSKSPRYISPEGVRMACRGISPFIARVGVFVNEPEDFIVRTVRQCGLSVVQLSGDEPPDFLSDAPFPVIKAIRVKNGDEIRSMASHRPGSTLVLDSFTPGSYGGNGVRFDWSLPLDVIGEVRIIIAGGLTAENVRQAIEFFRPFGVDVASGIEESPGIKDHGKMRRFIETVKRYGGNTHDELS